MRELTRLEREMNRLEVEAIFTPDLRQPGFPFAGDKKKDWDYISDDSNFS